MDEKIKKLSEWVAGSDNIVFFGGAGVSTESGIPDFRSVDGLYHQQWDYPPEEILSHSFFIRNPETYYRYHREKLVIEGAKPNRAHERLAELEAVGKLKAVITQNIDSLHQMAGSRNVLELHGSIYRNYCMSCGKDYPPGYISAGTDVPRCLSCCGVIRPDIVFYEEALDPDIMALAVEYIRKADVLIVGGTSLVVYPAAGMINDYRGRKLVLINKSATSYDSRADLVIADSIGKVLDQV